MLEPPKKVQYHESSYMRCGTSITRAIVNGKAIFMILAFSTFTGSCTRPYSHDVEPNAHSVWSFDCGVPCRVSNRLAISARSWAHAAKCGLACDRQRPRGWPRRQAKRKPMHRVYFACIKNCVESSRPSTSKQ